MGVIGHWRRSVLGAGGVALLLPLGLALGVALTTAIGGGQTLRALGQVFAGPSAPTARGGPSEPGLESANDVPSVPVRKASPSAPTSSTPGAPARGPGTSDMKPGGPSGPAPAPTPGPDPGSDPDPTTPTPPSPDPTPPASPTPPAASGGSAANEAGQAVADAVESLPAPVGAVGGNAAQTVVDLIP